MLPGVDPVTTFFQTAPLIILFEISIVSCRMVEKQRAKREAEEAANLGLKD